MERLDGLEPGSVEPVSRSAPVSVGDGSRDGRLRDGHLLTGQSLSVLVLKCQVFHPVVIGVLLQSMSRSSSLTCNSKDGLTIHRSRNSRSASLLGNSGDGERTSYQSIPDSCRCSDSHASSSNNQLGENFDSSASSSATRATAADDAIPLSGLEQSSLTTSSVGSTTQLDNIQQFISQSDGVTSDFIRQNVILRSRCAAGR